MRDPKTEAARWCDAIARLGADALVDGGLVGKDAKDRARGIIEEELLVRLTVQDYPPKADFTS
jgi:hypothetical protein